METIYIEEFECQRCGSHIFAENMFHYGLFICAAPANNSACCGQLVRVYCETCGQHYPFEGFIKQNNEYVCCTCGKPHKYLTMYVQAAAQAYEQQLSPEEKRLLQIKQEAEAFAERMRRERKAFDK